MQQGRVASNPISDITEVLRKMTSIGQEGGYQLGAAVDPSLNDIGGKRCNNAIWNDSGVYES
jgi:hypothetical protein